MRSPRLRSRGPRLAMLAIAVLGLAAAAAGIARSMSSGPIPDAQGVIHACYKNPNGLARIVSSDANCTRAETPIQWNQTGVQGPQGETGPQGPQGSQGPQGPPGTAGGLEVITAKFEATASAPALELDPVTERGVFVELPGPATYWLTVTGEVAGTGVAVCDLQVGADQERRVLKADPGVVTLALADVRFAAAPSELALAFCREVAGGNLVLNSIRIVAVKVD